jgi:hypothetical protein
MPAGSKASAAAHPICRQQRRRHLEEQRRGAAWTDLGLPQYRGVNAIAVDFPGTTVYSGLANAGVAVSGYFKANLGRWNSCS